LVGAPSWRQPEKCKIPPWNPLLLKAGHFCGKADHGSDDWRNGLPPCSTHHDAFDAHLFAIEPGSFEIVMSNGITPTQIGITKGKLSGLHAAPHRDALSWRYKRTLQKWASQHAPNSAATELVDVGAQCFVQPDHGIS
jgi:hypothetical protein